MLDSIGLLPAKIWPLANIMLISCRFPAVFGSGTAEHLLRRYCNKASRAKVTLGNEEIFVDLIPGLLGKTKKGRR